MAKEFTTFSLIFLLAVFTLAGVPLVALIWEELSDVLAGEATGRSLISAAVALAAFSILLYFLARKLRKDRT